VVVLGLVMVALTLVALGIAVNAQQALGVPIAVPLGQLLIALAIVVGGLQVALQPKRRIIAVGLLVLSLILGSAGVILRFAPFVLGG
jgi:hypothetical protein